MKLTTITAAHVIDTFLLLLIGIGPKLALVPFVQITAKLDDATKRRVMHRMLLTAFTWALVLVLFGELLRQLLHFTIDSLSIAGGIILLVLAARMVLQDLRPDAPPALETDDPMKLAGVPLAVPYLLNAVGIVGLVTISAEAGSFSVLAVEIAVLAVVLLIDVIVFRWANQISAKLNPNRMLVTEKVFGFLIAAVAVQLILDGLVAIGSIAPLDH